MLYSISFIPRSISIGICLLISFISLQAQQKILIVTSNQEFYGDTDISTANHFKEIVVPYDEFTKAGFEVNFVSPEGGAIPIGYIDTSDPIQKQYIYDASFMNQLKHTYQPSEIDAGEYAAVFYGGGGAAMYGVPENVAIQNIARKVYEENGIVSAICHGTAGLAYLKDASGNSLFQGKKITGFPDQFENKSKAYYQTFPFAMNEAIEKNGGQFLYSEDGWDGYYIADGRFVTGQDPSSAAVMAKEIIKLIQENHKSLAR